jgi:hypothetical protein
MKAVLWTLVVLAVLGLGAARVEAQAYYDPYYAPYPYGTPYQLPVQEAYPYSQLEALHYQLYVPYHQAYPVYPFYQPCCIAGPVIIAPAPVVVRSRPVVVNRPAVRRR